LNIVNYQTKIHEGVVPSNLTKYGKCITVNDGLTNILDNESNKKKMNTPVKENFCKNFFQTPKSNQNKGNDFANMKFKWKYVVLQGRKPFNNIYEERVAYVM
jgi:hypothetical protein